MQSPPSSRQQAVTALRMLALDAIQKANSGHPGMVLGMADLAGELFTRHLRHNPADPHWPDRDRFVLSNGHGSMLLYGLLHLCGYDLSCEDLASFRQLGSRTPGHPEKGITPGVETTTGPLGQGLATSVGMALAEKILSARFNRPGFDIIDHRTWVFAGDGCLMEGVSQEAISLAGVQKLGKLILFWDDNGVSIDGALPGWFAEDVPQRFRSAGWNTAASVDGHNPEQISLAISQAIADPSAPWLIPCRTRIGYGLPGLEGKAAAHSGAVGKKMIAQLRKEWSWPHEPFVVPKAVRSWWDMRDEGAQKQQAWQEMMSAYAAKYQQQADELQRRLDGRLPPLDAHFTDLFQSARGADIATRKALQNALESTAPLLPELMGSSADLASSNGVLWSGTRAVTSDNPNGNYLHAGVREFGMSAAMNGIALHGGLRPFGGTFLTFSDYARPAVRLAAMMEQPVIFVYSHDTIALGEDGPTHQPVEHLTALRAIPNLELWRPADALETAVAWQQILQLKDRPAALILSRQTLPSLSRDNPHITPDKIAAGAYIARNHQHKSPALVLMAAGSEVSICVEAAEILAKDGIEVRVLSVPCLSLLTQNEVLQRELLPADVPRLAVEAGVGSDWWRWLNPASDDLISLNQFGASAPGDEAMRHFGFSGQEIATRAMKLLQP